MTSKFSASVDSALLTPRHGGRKAFLMIGDGYVDNTEGHWVEDEEDGTAGFLEVDEHFFWVYDDSKVEE